MKMRAMMMFALCFAIPVLAKADLQTVPQVDVNQYVGRWFQIARNPLFFENGCVCSVQDLSALPNGTVAVVNTCNFQSPAGALRKISGTATSEDTTTNARFSIDFGLPQKGEYWIIGLDANYRYAVVSDPSRRSLYILSKTPTLDPALYQAAVASAALQVDTSQLLETLQTGCTYP